MTDDEVPRFPFSAVVGAQQVKTALLLAAIEPTLGGVLLRGDKGSAKSTLARGLAAVLGDGVPFVDLPLGATEERVVGSLDLAAAFTGGEVRLQRGLLAAAHGGVLYVDEVNLLADHLVDVLLDVAASGVNVVERDGLSQRHEARFLLIGSMNAEEGELRPQLLDRFGLAVDVRNPREPAARVEIVRRRSAFDADAVAFVAAWAAAEGEVASALSAARRRLAAAPDAVLLAASELCVAAGAESLRADLALGRAAAAHAAWCGRAEATFDDLRVVAELVLGHRQRRHPLDPSSGGSAVGEALDEVLGEAASEDAPAEGPPPGTTSGQPPRSDREPNAASDSDPGAPADAASGEGVNADRPDQEGRAAGLEGRTENPAAPPQDAGRWQEPGAARAVTALAAPRAKQPAGDGRRSPTETTRGRVVGDRAPQGRTLQSVAVMPTLRAATARRASQPPTAGRGSGLVEAADLREPIRQARSGNLLVVAVDASGSMGAAQRMSEVKGALLGLLVDAYQRRDRVALVTFGGEGATVVLRPTGSIEVARRRLAELRTGGDTPLADGIRLAAEVAARGATPVLAPILVVVTDGRATAGAKPWADAVQAGEGVRRQGLASVVVDVESGPAALGLAAQLAAVMGARHLPLPVFTAGRLQRALTDVTAPT